MAGPAGFCCLNLALSRRSGGAALPVFARPRGAIADSERLQRWRSYESVIGPRGVRLQSPLSDRCNRSARSDYGLVRPPRCLRGRATDAASQSPGRRRRRYLLVARLKTPVALPLPGRMPRGPPMPAPAACAPARRRPGRPAVAAAGRPTGPGPGQSVRAPGLPRASRPGGPGLAAICGDSDKRDAPAARRGPATTRTGRCLSPA